MQETLPPDTLAGQVAHGTTSGIAYGRVIEKLLCNAKGHLPMWAGFLDFSMALHQRLAE